MKRILIIPIILSLAIAIADCGRISENAFDVFDIVSIQSYKDIPGVTEKEISAIEALKLTRSSFSFAHLLETEAFINSDGVFAGFTYEFCELMTQLFGIEFNGVLCDTWQELLTKFNQKEIDFTGALTASPERMEIYHMTRPIAERKLGVFTHIDSNKLKSELDINGLIVGFLPNTVTAENIKKTYSVSFEDVEVADFSMAANMLESGEIDAFITASVVDPNFVDYKFIKSRVMFPLSYTLSSLATANSDLEPIISVINKYLSAGGVNKLVQLYSKGNFEYSQYKLNKSFTEAERAYLDTLFDTGDKVNTAFEYDNFPISFYNDNDKEFQGIAIDILMEISRLTGVAFESATTKTTTWEEVLEQLKSGDISLVTELAYSNLLG